MNISKTLAIVVVMTGLAACSKEAPAVEVVPPVAPAAPVAVPAPAAPTAAATEEGTKLVEDLEREIDADLVAEDG